jgi:ribosome-binding factor A
MEGKRQAKFSRLLQKEMGDIFLKEGSRMFGNLFISVSAVRVTPDLGYAKFYLTFLNEKNPQKLINLIKMHNKELRIMLSSRIGKVVRKIPELEFFYDDTMDYVEKMDKIFDEIRPKDDSEGRFNEEDYKEDK